MLAHFERKEVNLSDNATQTQTKMTENMVEIKKILKIRIYKCWFMGCYVRDHRQFTTTKTSLNN